MVILALMNNSLIEGQSDSQSDGGLVIDVIPGAAEFCSAIVEHHVCDACVKRFRLYQSCLFIFCIDGRKAGGESSAAFSPDAFGRATRFY